MWRSLEPGCYVGENDLFRAPRCDLTSLSGKVYDDPDLSIDAYRVNNPKYVLDEMGVQRMTASRTWVPAFKTGPAVKKGFKGDGKFALASLSTSNFQSRYEERTEKQVTDGGYMGANSK